jgi:phosphoribosylamine-glycine ligase
VKILLASSGAIGAWFLLRLMQEGHDVEWFLIEPEPRQRQTLHGLIPPPLSDQPEFAGYDLVVFDSTGNDEIAEQASKVAPVIGDSELASRLEDDRLFGIQVMEESGIEVPPYEQFKTPEEAKAYLLENPKRFVYKPFVVNGKEQPCDLTYVSESAEDLVKSIDALFAESGNAPFLLQEVVEGTEISTEGYFDGTYFHFLNHTIEEKKFMSGSFGPNTGCSGNLVWALDRPNRLCTQGILRLIPFLKESGYRGMIDLNTIVSENHAYGLEFTPRFGYDASASIFSLLDGDLGQFFYDIVTAPDEGWVDHNPVPPFKAHWAASVRLTAPPYPEEHADFDVGLPIKGVDPDWAWRNCYLWDARLKGGDLVTVGTNGIVACPIATAHTPEGAWESLDRLAKKIKFPNLQRRDDLCASTMKRLKEASRWGWLD